MPFAGFARELLASVRGERIELRAAVVLGLPPLGLDESFLLELEEGGVQRAVVEGEAIPARLLDAAGDAVAVERAQALERLEDHEGERALPDIQFVGHLASYGKPI